MAYTTINKSTDHFNTKLFTGNGSTQSITGVGFQPDWVWFKNRSSTQNHILFDAVRGAGKNLKSNDTTAEINAGTGTDGQLRTFDSDGFSVGSDGSVNNNGENIASWNWKANGAGSANTDGSISSTVSANTTAGFSIVKFTGTGANGTVGHGLGVAPKVIITKSRGNAENWGVYHSTLGNTKQLELNNNVDATSASSAYYNNTSPTSSVFSVGTADSTNDAANMIAYCFAEKTGYSKFGTYIGNGNADGPFVYTGFKPAWVLIKSYAGGDDWWGLSDNKRQTSVNDGTRGNLLPSSNAVEGTLAIDYLSNGFKLRNTNTGTNGNNSWYYVYMAFASAPLVGSNNIPATAR